LELIYGESVRKLDQQAGVLEALKGRTALLLGAGSISTSFLAPAAIKQAGWAWEAWAGSGCLVGVTALTLLILWPTGGWVFSHKPKELLRVYVDGGRTINGMYKWLGGENEDYVVANRTQLTRLFTYFEFAIILLGLSIAFWLALLAK
jgi:hypothetical protein